MPTVSDHLRSLFNRHRKTDLTKRINVENAVGKAQLIINSLFIPSLNLFIGFII